MEPFWKTKTLEAMTHEEWESLCDGCGRCCLHKLRHEDTNELSFTNVACRLLDLDSCRCGDYAHRRRRVTPHNPCLWLRDVAAFDAWPQVKAIGYAIRLTRHPDGRESSEIRYYILSRYLSGKRFAEAVRGHWGIESMHWTLDVTFREDDSRTRERTLANNLSWLRRFAVSLLKRHPANDSLRGKMQAAGYNTDFLAEVLMQKQV